MPKKTPKQLKDKPTTKAGEAFQKNKALFVNSLLHNANATQAYKDVHPDRQSIESINPDVKRYTNDPQVRESVAISLDKSGLGISYLNSRLRILTDAEKKIVVGERLVDVPDNNTSLEALKVAYKLHKLIDSPVVNIDARQQTIDLSSENIIKIDGVVQSLDKLTQSMRTMTITGEVQRE